MPEFPDSRSAIANFTEQPQLIIERRQTLYFDGFNPDVDSGDVPEDIWPADGLINFANTAGPVTIVSDNANDTAAGSGARTLLLDGVDENFQQITEEVTLNGITPVVSLGDFLHVQRAFVSSVGATRTNEGTISFQIDGGQVNVMAPGKSQTQACARVIPAPNVEGTDAYLVRIDASVGKQQNLVAVVSIDIRPVNAADVIFRTIDYPLNSNGGNLALEFKTPIRFLAGTVVAARVTEVSANNGLVAAALQFAWY